MPVYERFASFYAKGLYTQFTEGMAEILPSVLERFNAQPRSVLDLACGEGTFAVAMSKRGLQVKGIDLSPQMVRLARELAERENVKTDFFVHDMRSLSFEEEFDLVTCWYDSLNYLLALKDLERTFEGVCRALRRDGLFIFDMNTIYGLAVKRQRHPCFVQEDGPDTFEVHCHHYDFERNMDTFVITVFVRKGSGWSRIDEEHKERGYSLDEIRRCLEKSGLGELACWGNLQEMSEPEVDSGRVYFLAKKRT